MSTVDAMPGGASDRSASDPVVGVGYRPVQRPRLADSTNLVVGWASLALLAYLVYRVIDPFLMPLAWAAVFAIVIHPVHAALVPRVGASRAAAAGTLAVALVLLVPAVVVAPVFAQEAFEAAAYIQRVFMEGRFAAIERAWEGLAGAIPASEQVDLPAVLADAVRRLAALVVARSGLILRDAAMFFFNIVVALFATFFLLRDSALVMRTVRRLLPMDPRGREALIARTTELVFVSVTSAVVVAGIQGVLGGLAFRLLGVPSPVFWGVVMGLFCLLPFGAWVIWLPAAILLALDGEMTRAILLAVAGVTIVSAADNVLRPLLVSGRTHMNGLVILVGLLGGMSVFGLLGIVLGPILVATALALLEAYAAGPQDRPAAMAARSPELEPIPAGPSAVLSKSS